LVEVDPFAVALTGALGAALAGADAAAGADTLTGFAGADSSPSVTAGAVTISA
jgi:hypothetical protein